MQTPARSGGTDRPLRTTPARISVRRSAVRALPAAALLLAGLLAGPGDLRAQPSDAAPGEDVTARVAVEPVVAVSPRGPVTVSFPSPPTSDTPGRPVEASADVRLACAGNTVHEARVRLVSVRERTAASGPDGELQWTAGRGGGWTPLRAEPARVVGALEAGRHEECATVRFRWVPPEAASTAAPPAEVTVAFEGASAPAGGGDGRAK